MYNTHAQNNEKEKKLYVPNEQIMSYLRDAIQFAPELERLKYAGEPVTENKRYQSLRQKKKRAFDVLFESGANLMLFMEELSKPENKKLRESLDPDLERLFLSPEMEDKFRKPMFWRLIDSLLDWNYDDKKENVDNFRLMLMSIMQDLIGQHVTSVSRLKTGEFASHAINEDFRRASGWMQSFSANVTLNE